MEHAAAAATEQCLSKEQVREVLGLTTDRSVYLLADQGKIELRTIERQGKRPIRLYTEESVRAYKDRRDNGTVALAPYKTREIRPFQQQALPPPAAEEPEPEDDGEPDTLAIQPWQFMTLAEAARHLRVDQVLVRDAIDAGRLSFIRRRTGGILVKRSDVEALPAWERHKPKSR